MFITVYTDWWCQFWICCHCQVKQLVCILWTPAQHSCTWQVITVSSPFNKIQQL